MALQRKAGILLHPTSLPGKYGIGDLGKQAFGFIDFLSESGQNLWQILPLTPTSFGDSPYQSFSTFAGNTLLISPDELIKEGFLTYTVTVPDFSQDDVDYGTVIEYKTGLYKEAFYNFKKTGSTDKTKAFELFKTENSNWLLDYALFMSIKEYFIKKRKDEGFSQSYDEFFNKAEKFMETDLINDYFFGGTWVTWPKDILNKNKESVESYKELLAEEIEYHSFLQYEFFREWNQVKNYANEKDISIIGDLPIFIAFDSVDCWANKEMFMLDEDGFPVDTAGVPPDYFSETGQLWGNPLYDWDYMAKTGYKWWIERIKKTSEICDYIRIDHFRGFDSYWAVPFGDKTAVNGEWRKGPKTALFDAIEKALGELPIIAEDLGLLTESVYELRDNYNLPGMKVLQFAFGDTNENPFLPHNYSSSNCVVYTGTHDNNTTVGWFSDIPEYEKDYIRRYMNCNGSDIAWDLIRLAYSSTAAFAVIPLQDCLSLPASARMNLPGTPSGNWKWRFTEDMLNDGISAGLKYLGEIFNRTDTILPDTDMDMDIEADIEAEVKEGD